MAREPRPDVTAPPPPVFANAAADDERQLVDAILRRDRKATTSGPRA